jgi:transposase InsO family protein
VDLKWIRTCGQCGLEPAAYGNNGSLRKELLDAYLFYSLPEVRQMAQEWQQDYNYERPHDSLRNVPPVFY